MQLIHIVHKAEAESFREHLLLKSVPSPIEGLYRFPAGFLLITGEGGAPVNSSVSATLALFPEIQTVIHYGLAARLEPLLPSELFSVRSVYQENQGTPDFHSFTSSDPNARHDVLSASRRLLNPEVKEKLSHFASVVDRELFSLAFAAQNFHKSFYAYKIPVDSIENGQVCTSIQSLASDYSETYWKHYTQFFMRTEEKTEKEDIAFPAGFYFTTSQKNIYKKYLNFLSLVETDKELLEWIREQEKIPKKRTARLLEHLRSELNPIETEAREKIKNLTAEVLPPFARIDLPARLESNTFELRAFIQSRNDLKIFAESITEISYESIVKYMNGIFEPEQK